GRAVQGFEAMTNLMYSDVEDDLRRSVEGFLRSKLSSGAVAALYDGDRAALEVWPMIDRELGLGGLLFGEDHGGAGAGARAAAVVAETLGASVAPAPFLTSAVASVMALRTIGEDSPELK